MVRNFEVQPADIVIFRHKISSKTNLSDVDAIAVIVDERGALYVDRKLSFERVKWIPLREVSTLTNVSVRRPEVSDNLKDRIAHFFLRNVRSPPVFKSGLHHMRADNYSVFERGSLFPIRPEYKSDDEYEAAWLRFNSRLLPSDGIFTVRMDDRVSRFIAWATHGPWSHVAIYKGNGEIVESVTSGIREAPLSIYKGRHYWIAAYRHIQTIGRSDLPTPTKEWGLKRFRDGYNYRGAIKYGIRSFVNDHSHALVPNSMIYCGMWKLIDHV
jgi:hypothetical protein